MTETTEAVAGTDAATSNRKTLWVGDLGLHVRTKVKKLSHLYLADTSEGVKAVAQLSRAAGTPLERSSMEVLKWTIDGIPETYIPSDGSGSREERAAHAAVTLYALQQHSNRERSAQDDFTSLATAIGSVYRESDEQEGILRRFNAALTAVSWEENQTYLRSLVQFLRKSKSAIDYGRLAEDLRSWQIPSQQDRIRLSWGRDFYRVRADPALATGVPAQQATDTTD